MTKLEELKARLEKQQQNREKFKAWLEYEHSVTDHPKADKLFELAWSYGHAAGHHEVAGYYQELVELIK